MTMQVRRAAATLTIAAATLLGSVGLSAGIAEAKPAPKPAPFNWGQAATNVVGGSVNVLFGGSYGGGGHAFGSDQGTWWAGACRAANHGHNC